MKRSEKIETIRNRFRKHPEWLIIRVTTMDTATTTPLTGRLLAHSPDRDTIYRKSLAYKGLIFIDSSEEKLPKGYAIAF